MGRTLRIRSLIVTSLAVTLAACETGAPATSPPPPPPSPLTASLSMVSRSAAILSGQAAPQDSVTIAISGDGASAASWTAAARRPHTTVVAGSGTGSGKLRWQRNAEGLAVGVYVDTITVQVPGADGSPLQLLDSLVITSQPIPVTLALQNVGRRSEISVGEAAPRDSVAVILSGTGASDVNWQASSTQRQLTLTTASAQGSGLVRWNRSGALAVGTYIDTITVTASGVGSVARFIDTLIVQVPAVPLALVVSPSSRSASVLAGAAAPSDSATVTLSGDNASTAGWSAAKKKSWTTLTTSGGSGSGKVRWSRNTTGLAAGTYVDTITVTVPGATGSPDRVIDTLRITAAPSGQLTLGPMGSLNGWRPFPDSDPWNQPVDQAEIDPNSVAILSKVGLGKSLHPDFFANYDGGPYGIPWIVVPDDTPRFPFIFEYWYESDPGPYPVPPNPPIEGNGGGDAHLIVITQNERKLYETFYTHFVNGQWTAGSGAIFDLVNGTQRPQGWTSADAAGLPIFAGLVRGDEVIDQGEIRHALRFTITNSQRAYVPPATHWASSKTDPLLPPMGMRVRLKASVDISGYCTQCQVILRALKKYGMIVADNGGDFFLNGAPDPRWDDDGINTLKQIKVSDFEVVKMVGVVKP